MVSEAISAGRKVIVFRLSKKNDAVTKHERALKTLADQGYIAIVEASGLVAALEKAWNDKTAVKPPEDMDRIFEALKRLI
jgi:mitochondrial fission protein ELM1